MIEQGSQFQKSPKKVRKNIKFKTLHPQFLPYLECPKANRSTELSKFSKRSFDDRWRSQAQLKKQIYTHKQQYKQQQNSQLALLKKQLKNESQLVKMQRKNLQKRLEANLLVRAIMKQLAINQQDQLMKNNLID